MASTPLRTTLRHATCYHAWAPSSGSFAAGRCRRRAPGCPSWRRPPSRPSVRGTCRGNTRGSSRAGRPSPASTSASSHQAFDLARPARASRTATGAGPHVVVLEVEQRQLRIVPAQAVAVDVGAEQIPLRDPVELAVELRRVALERGERCSQRSSTGAPISSPPQDFEAGLVGVLAREPEELPLQLDRGAPAERRDVDRRAAASGRARPCASRGPGRDRQVLVDEAVFDHREHDRGRADLEERRDLAQVRVADDHVQAPVLLRIGVRFVAAC